MLLPTFSIAVPIPGLPSILFGQECDMPHGFFGDRDASARASEQRLPPGCGLFGRLGDAPPPPADAPARAETAPRDRTEATPRDRA